MQDDLQDNLQGGLQLNQTFLTLVNGANHNVAITGKTGIVTITGPTGVYNITGIQGGSLGRTIKLVNSTAFTLTLTCNSAGSSAGNRLFTTGSVDKTIPAYAAVNLTYTQTQGGDFWVDV